MSFDPEADAAYVRLAEGKIDSSSEVAQGLIIDWSVADEPIGLEVLYVASRLKCADVDSFIAGLVEGLFATNTVTAEAAK